MIEDDVKSLYVVSQMQLILVDTPWDLDHTNTYLGKI